MSSRKQKINIFIDENLNKRKTTFILKLLSVFPPKSPVRKVSFYDISPYWVQNPYGNKAENGYVLGRTSQRDKSIEIFWGKIKNRRPMTYSKMLHTYLHELGHIYKGTSEKAAERYAQKEMAKLR